MNRIVLVFCLSIFSLLANAQSGTNKVYITPYLGLGIGFHGYDYGGSSKVAAIYDFPIGISAVYGKSNFHFGGGIKRQGNSRLDQKSGKINHFALLKYYGRAEISFVNDGSKESGMSAELGSMNVINLDGSMSGLPWFFNLGFYGSKSISDRVGIVGQFNFEYNSFKVMNGSSTLNSGTFVVEYMLGVRVGI